MRIRRNHQVDYFSALPDNSGGRSCQVASLYSSRLSPFKWGIGFYPAPWQKAMKYSFDLAPAQRGRPRDVVLGCNNGAWVELENVKVTLRDFDTIWQG